MQRLKLLTLTLTAHNATGKMKVIANVNNEVNSHSHMPGLFALVNADANANTPGLPPYHGVPMILGAQWSGALCSWSGHPWRTGPRERTRQNVVHIIQFMMSYLIGLEFPLAWTRVTGAPSWSQAWGWGTLASTWWPSLCPWGPSSA